MNDIDNYGRDDDDRIAQALVDLVSYAELDDLQFERLAGQIGAAGAEPLRRLRVAQRTVRMQWAGGVISAALAASAALVLVLHAVPSPQVPVSSGSFAVSGVTDPVREDRQNLLAASVGAISEDDFLANVWEHVDTEALLGGGRE
jgi:hypothetical protein